MDAHQHTKYRALSVLMPKKIRFYSVAEENHSFTGKKVKIMRICSMIRPHGGSNPGSPARKHAFISLATFLSLGFLSSLAAWGNGFVEVPVKQQPSFINYSLYHQSDILLQEVEALVARHQDKMQMKILKSIATGYSAEIAVVTFARGQEKAEDDQKIRILLNFGQHGREMITTEVALRLLNVLAGEYHLLALDRNAQNDILQKLVIKVVPMENLNGRKMVEAGKLCERKNGRGVDINRNWSVDWGKKEKDYDPSEEYPGTAPFSEPETKIMRKLVHSFKPHLWVNVHSGMEALFMPYDHRNTTPDGASAKLMKLILQKLNHLHCKDNCVVGSPIIPVFYDVEPADLRWVTKGLYADAFSKYETKGRYNSETLKKWRLALHNVSFRDGYEFNRNSDEGNLLVRIVDRVQQEIKNKNVPFEVATYPVGLDDAVRDFEDVIRSARVQSVQIVGVVGTGGLGKTTLARELYNRKFKAFDKCSFLSDVREAALPDLQKKLLEDLLHLRDIPFKDAIHGMSILAGRLRSTSRRVLIILDDVDHVDQLNALLPKKGTSLGSGSLIIVTTRDSGVLTKWDISSVYKMTTLDPRHAKELFCLHAFKGVSPPDTFKDLVNKFVVACDGLPLSLKVIAEMLYKKPEEEWKSELMKISRLLPGEIKERLRLSYDALDEEEQNIFLDVACFFVGEKKKMAIAVWDAARWSGLENLVSKCLVEVDKQNRIRMPNHLRDLGRELASECSLRRLWSSEQMTKISKYRQQRTLVRGIMAATTQFFKCPAHDEFPKCCDTYRPLSEECMDLRSLELLVVNGKYFTPSDFAEPSMNLVWLRLFDFQGTDLPSWLSLTNLRVLELYGASGLQLLENRAHFPKELREMIITATKGNIFNKFPSEISGLKHLRKIALISDHGEEFLFATLPEEICSLQSLEHLELRYCKFLSSLPNCFGKLKKLHHLDLCSCEKLRKLPESFMQLASLEYLDLSGCRLPEILDPMPEILKNIRNLKNLYFSGCRLQKLPEHTTDQQSLRELHLEDTMLRNVPSNISQLSKLETLKIGSPYLRNLPTSLGDLPSLTNLKIKGCDKLKYLPPSVERLKLLESLYLEDSEVESLPEGFRQLTNLQTLQIFDCPIAELDFSSASSSSLGKLKVIHLKGTNVTRVLISQDCCPSLETLQLELNRHLMEIDILSTSVKMVKVFKCPKLHNIKGIRNLVNLKTLEIKGCQKLDEDTVAAVGTWECFNSVQSHTDVQFFLNPVEGHNASVSFEGGYETEQEVNLEVCLG